MAYRNRDKYRDYNGNTSEDRARRRIERGTDTAYERVKRDKYERS